jgi:hypothetical protein
MLKLETHNAHFSESAQNIHVFHRRQSTPSPQVRSPPSTCDGQSDIPHLPTAGRRSVSFRARSNPIGVGTQAPYRDRVETGRPNRPGAYPSPAGQTPHPGDSDRARRARSPRLGLRLTVGHRHAPSNLAESGRAQPTAPRAPAHTRPLGPGPPHTVAPRL